MVASAHAPRWECGHLSTTVDRILNLLRQNLTEGLSGKLPAHQASSEVWRLVTSLPPNPRAPSAMSLHQVLL